MKPTLRRGGALIVAIVTLMVVMLVAGTVARSLVASRRQARRMQGQLQAQSLADAALARGLAQLRSQAEYTGETWRPAVSAEANGYAEIRVQRAAAAEGGDKLVVTARYPDEAVNTASVTRELALDAPQETP
jgi:Tfp pilus assembly protein PilX